MANCCVSLITVHITTLDTLIKWNIQEPLDLSVFHQTNYFKILWIKLLSLFHSFSWVKYLCILRYLVFWRISAWDRRKLSIKTTRLIINLYSAYNKSLKQVRVSRECSYHIAFWDLMCKPWILCIARTQSRMQTPAGAH